MIGVTRKASDVARLAAESATSAFSLLVDRAVEMGHVGVESGPYRGSPLPSEWECGVMFELEGPIEAWVALLFRASQREALVEHMLGERAARMGDAAVESALMEVANIVVSHVASGIAEALGEKLLPSVPMLAAREAAAELDRLMGPEERALERHRCELSDANGEFGGLLVLVAPGPEAGCPPGPSESPVR